MVPRQEKGTNKDLITFYFLCVIWWRVMTWLMHATISSFLAHEISFTPCRMDTQIYFHTWYFSQFQNLLYRFKATRSNYQYYILKDSNTYDTKLFNLLEWKQSSCSLTFLILKYYWNGLKNYTTPWRFV